MMGSRNMEARRYAADVRARVTGAAGGCSPHERSDMREQSRISLRHAGYACYSFAPRDAFLAALRADQRARSRFTARTVMGATTCNAMEAAPATSPLTRSNARSGPKYHMTPRPCRRGTAGQRWAKKENGKAPSVAGGAPEKIPVRNCQRTRNILGSPAQGGLKNAELPHLGGRAIETAHDDTPKTKTSSPLAELSPPAAPTRAYTTEPDGLSVRYFTIGKTSEALSWMGSCGGAYANSAITPSANPP